MTLGLVAEKIGMTQIFTDSGDAIPVTVLAYEDCPVIQIKTVDTDGYDAIQVSYGKKKQRNKAIRSHYAKAEVEARGHLMEFRVQDPSQFKLGDKIDMSVLEGVKKVSVFGTSKGKGFAGCVKRHHFKMQDATHGNSLSHRAPGSTGQCQDPGRVFKGKKMAGQMGDVSVCVQNLDLVKLDKDKKYILIKGGVPGARGSIVVIQPAGTNPKSVQEQR